MSRKHLILVYHSIYKRPHLSCKESARSNQEKKEPSYETKIKRIARNGILRDYSRDLPICRLGIRCPLLGLEEEDCAVSEVEVNEVLRLCREMSMNIRHGVRIFMTNRELRSFQNSGQQCSAR